MIGNKILIVGCPGAGKSYFARELNELSNIPLYYLDCMFWKENWTHISTEELLNELKHIFSTPNWIIDGNYSKTLEERFVEADTVFFLDMSEEECLKAVSERCGTKRPDLPDYLEEKEDLEFIDFIKKFQTTGRVKILSLMEKYKDKTYYTFKSKTDKNLWLDEYSNYLIQTPFFQEKYNKYFNEYKNIEKNDSLELYSVFHFEMSKKWANSLLQMVLDGRKKATSSSFNSYIKEQTRMPQVGDLSIVTDWIGNPRCIIKTTKVRVIPFNQMTYDVIKLEGEDDCLETWVLAHQKLFTLECIELGYEFKKDMKVVFEEFEVVYK